MQDKLYELHISAGLIDGGLNEEDDREWIGDDEAWNRYRKLEKEFYENQ